MAQAAPEVSAELKIQITTITVEGWNNYMTNCSEEQKAAGIEEMKKYADPEYAAQQQSEHQTMFTESDADGDGRLTQEEYVVMINKQKAKAEAKGLWVDSSMDRAMRYYTILDQLSEGPGVTFDDIKTAMSIARPKLLELKMLESISPEIKAAVEALTVEGYDNYMNNCSEEQKQKGLEEMQRWKNPDYAAEKMAEVAN